jgi:putative FmdB family regulatory protein
MPLFEYRCNQCQAEFEILIRKPETEAAVCPKCGGASLAQQLSTFLSPVAGKNKPAPRHSKEHDVYTPRHDD